MLPGPSSTVSLCLLSFILTTSTSSLIPKLQHTPSLGFCTRDALCLEYSSSRCLNGSLSYLFHSSAPLYLMGDVLPGLHMKNSICQYTLFPSLLHLFARLLLSNNWFLSYFFLLLHQDVRSRMAKFYTFFPLLYPWCLFQCLVCIKHPGNVWYISEWIRIIIVLTSWGGGVLWSSIIDVNNLVLCPKYSKYSTTMSLHSKQFLVMAALCKVDLLKWQSPFRGQGLAAIIRWGPQTSLHETIYSDSLAENFRII